MGADEKPEEYTYPSTPLDMFDLYHDYVNMFALFEFSNGEGFIFTGNLDKPSCTGGNLVQFFFSQHTDKEISPEQAQAFAPIFYFQVIIHLPDDAPTGDIKADANRRGELLKRLFEDKRFYFLIEGMFEYYVLIEPFLIDELHKLYELHPETAERHRVQFSDLQSLVFSFEQFTDDELEPLFETLREKRTALRFFEYVYAAVKAARRSAAEYYKGDYDWTKPAQPQERPVNIPDVSSLKLERIGYPVDKVNNNLWGNLPIGKPIHLKAESDKDNRKGKTADIITMLNFEELDGVKISRPLTIYDKRVFIAVANLVNEGQYILTPTMIDKAMGATTKTNAADKEKILESLAALVRARVTIDNTTEAKLYGYEHIKGDFPLLAASIVTAYVDGQLTEGALQVAELPKLFQFSINRNQVTTIPIKLLESPLNKTKANMTLEDYLIKRISQMNNPKKKVPHKILLSTLYEKCDIKERKQRTRLIKDKLPRLLNHHVKTGNIKGYTIDSTHITIISPTKE